MKKLLVVLIGCLSASAVWGRSFSIDLCQKVEVPAVAAPSSEADDSGCLRRVVLDAGSANVGRVTVGDEITFKLFADVSFTLTLKKRLPSALGGSVFLAEASGREGLKTAIVLDAGTGLSVDILDHLNMKVYKVISSETGVTVQEMESKGGKCGCDAVCPAKPGETSSGNLLNAKKNVAAMSAGSGEVTVDILVAYEKNASLWAASNGGGTTAFALMAVAKMNEVLVNSALDQYFHFRLVGVMEVAATSADFVSVLTSLTDGIGEWSSIKAKRDEVGADIVTVLIDTGSIYGVTGLGWSLDADNFAMFSESPYNVCSIRSVNQSYTMMHEVGHNMGCGHNDVYAADPGPQLYPYSSGYYFSAGGEKYHTVMAYGSEGPGGREVPYFSSPSCFYEGVAVGDATHDNRLTLINSYLTVSNWRAAKDITVEPQDGSEPTGEPNGADTVLAHGGVVADMTFSRAQTVISALYDSRGNPVGTVELKIGKKGSKGVKTSASATLLENGKAKKVGASAITLGSGDTQGLLSFKQPIGNMTFTMKANGRFALLNDRYEAVGLTADGTRAVNVGGRMRDGTMRFNVDMDKVPDFGKDGVILNAALPLGEQIKVSGGAKWQFNKAPSLKYKKNPSSGMYELQGLNDALRPNKSALKLTYTQKTGLFKGSFKVYSTNEGLVANGKSPKLKKFTVNVVGFVIDAVGIGQAVIAKPAGGPWSVRIEYE